MAPRTSRSKIVDLQEALPRVREALARDKALNGAGLARTGVPKARQPELLALLEAEGFERTRTGARIPLARQIAALLEERGILSIAELARLVRPAPQKEVRAAAAGLLSGGTATLVLRGKIEALAAASAPVLSREEVAALARACRALASLAAKAVRRGDATLLRADVREPLLDFVLQGQAQPRAPGLAASPAAAIASPAAVLAPAAVSLLDAAVAQLALHVRASVGLSFVPDTVRALSQHGAPAVHAALIEAARGGLIELQPDSGLDRLTPQELLLCPEGPQGTRLSWARLPLRAP